MSTAAANSKSLETSSSGKPVLTFVTGNPKKLEEVRKIVTIDFHLHKMGRVT